MFDTHVTIVGNVLTAPQWRRTRNTGSLVANFKVASTARRLDRETGRWVDGNSLRVRVTCWRKLAEGVASSVMTGDPVVVVGRLYTRDWQDENDNPRVGYELEAVAVGHDLSRGVGRFVRNRPALATSMVDDEQGSARIGGLPSQAVPPDEAPARRDDRLFDELGDGLPSAAPVLSGGYHPPKIQGRAELPGGVGTGDLAGDELGGDELAGDELGGDEPDGDDLDGDGLDGDQLSGTDLSDVALAGDLPDGSGPGRAGAGRQRVPVAA